MLIWSQFLHGFNCQTSNSCLQIARAFGASEIIAVDIQDDKLQKAKIFGATHAINAQKEDAVAKIKVHTLYFYF